MPSPITFIPKYAHPFTLEQAIQLEVGLLVNEIRRLENSIEHLIRTQRELVSFLEGEEAENEDGEIRKAKDENVEVIASQRERITLIKIALLNKVGEGGLRHYDLDPAVPVSKTATPSPTTSTLDSHAHPPPPSTYINSASLVQDIPSSQPLPQLQPQPETESTGASQQDLTFSPGVYL